jgi:hypothetical protein
MANNSSHKHTAAPPRQAGPVGAGPGAAFACLAGWLWADNSGFAVEIPTAKREGKFCRGRPVGPRPGCPGLLHAQGPGGGAGGHQVAAGGQTSQVKGGGEARHRLLAQAAACVRWLFEARRKTSTLNASSSLRCLSGDAPLAVVAIAKKYTSLFYPALPDHLTCRLFSFSSA